MDQKKINIFIFIDSLYGLGGSERNLLQIITHADKSRFSFAICPLSSEDGFILQELRRNGATIIRSQLKRIYGLKGLRQAFRLRKILKKMEIDIVQTIHFASDVYGALIARWARVPVIISNRRDMGYKFTELMHREPNRRRIWMRRIANRYIQKFISVSEEVRQTVSNEEQINPEKIITIYNSVDLSAFPAKCDRADLALKYGLNPGGPIVGVIANLRPIKGLEFFIQAAAEVMKSHPATQFMVVGYDGNNNDPEVSNYKRELLGLCQELGLHNNFYFMGFAENTAPFISMMDIFVLPSLSEGFSNSLLEAMASKKPVVATAVGGNKEAVSDGETGILVPPKDPVTLTAAINRLLENNELRLRMGNNGRLRAERLFSIKRMIKSLEDIYANALNNYSIMSYSTHKSERSIKHVG